MSTNWFGNSFAPALSYARGAILTSTEEDFRKLSHAWHGLPPEILERFGGRSGSPGPSTPRSTGWPRS
jgi:hypothetical protein